MSFPPWVCPMCTVMNSISEWCCEVCEHDRTRTKTEDHHSTAALSMLPLAGFDSVCDDREPEQQRGADEAPSKQPLLLSPIASSGRNTKDGYLKDRYIVDGGNDNADDQTSPPSLLTPKAPIGPDVIDLVEPEDGASPPQCWLRLVVEEDSLEESQELRLLLPTTLEIVKNRALEALDLWDADQTELSLWNAAKQCFELLLSVEGLADGSNLRLQVLERLQLDDVKVPAVGKVTALYAATWWEPALLETLQPDFACLRRIRGDGNCFYRAVVFSMMEQALMRIETALPYSDELESEELEASHIPALHALLAQLQGAKGLSKPDQDVLRELSMDLHHKIGDCRQAFAYRSERPPRVSPVMLTRHLRELVSAEDGSYDATLVRAMRLCIGNYLLDRAAAEEKEEEEREKEEKEEKEEEISTNSAGAEVEASASAAGADEDIRLVDVVGAGGMSVVDFVRDVVLCDGRDAEDVIVTFANHVFRMRLSVWHAHGGLLVPLMHRCQAEESGAEAALPDVNVLLHQGHYTLLYKKRQCGPQQRSQPNGGSVSMTTAANNSASSSSSSSSSNGSGNKKRNNVIDSSSESTATTKPATRELSLRETVQQMQSNSVFDFSSRGSGAGQKRKAKYGGEGGEEGEEGVGGRAVPPPPPPPPRKRTGPPVPILGTLKQMENGMQF